MITIPMTVSTGSVPIEMDVSSGSIGIDAELSTEYHVYQNYRGRATVTPTNNYQVLYTKNRLMNQNIVVEPIPSNYGRIIWSGGYLQIV